MNYKPRLLSTLRGLRTAGNLLQFCTQYKCPICQLCEDLSSTILIPLILLHKLMLSYFPVYYTFLQLYLSLSITLIIPLIGTCLFPPAEPPRGLARVRPLPGRALDGRPGVLGRLGLALLGRAVDGRLLMIANFHLEILFNFN